MRDIVELLEQRTAAFPDRLNYSFIEYSSEKKNLLLFELDQQSRALAALLQTRLKPGDRVMIALKPGLDYIVSLYAVIRGGFIGVPVFPLSPDPLSRSTQQLRSVAADCEARCILLDSRGLSAFENASGFDLSLWAFDPACIELGIEHFYNRPKISNNSAALLQYTSGSTGTPKGAIITHRNLLHNATQITKRGQQGEEDIQVLWLPLHHDMGLIGGVFAPLIAGFESILFSPFAFLKDPLLWINIVSKYRATITAAPTFAYGLTADAAAKKRLDGLDVSSIELACMSAEKVRSNVVESFIVAFEPIGFNKQALMAAYGLAEHTVLCTATMRGQGIEFHELSDRNQATVRAHGKVYANCGKAVEATSIFIVDNEDLSLKKTEEVGEIWIKGDSVAAGYWGRTEESETVFRAQSPDLNGHFLRTGDIGCLVNNELLVLGRVSDKIIVNGRNIHAEDVEAAVSSLGSKISACVAFPSRNKQFSEDVIIVAELSKSSQSMNPQLISNDIKRAVRRALDIVPSEVFLSKARIIPRTTSGKIQRGPFREKFYSGEVQFDFLDSKYRRYEENEFRTNIVGDC